MTDTRTEHTPGNDTRLWCLHHIGPDDVHAAPDFATAQTWANQANEFSQEYAGISRFVVAVWPWTADDHAENLPRSIAEWTVPAASVPAASEGDAFTALEAWQELVEYDDRTSPEEYPNMALITFEELRMFMSRASFTDCTCGDVAGEDPACLGHAPSDQSKLDEARSVLERALVGSPKYLRARVNTAISLLTRARQIGGEA